MFVTPANNLFDKKHGCLDMLALFPSSGCCLGEVIFGQRIPQKAVAGK
jgi:hypothetical protein